MFKDPVDILLENTSHALLKLHESEWIHSTVTFLELSISLCLRNSENEMHVTGSGIVF